VQTRKPSAFLFEESEHETIKMEECESKAGDRMAAQCRSRWVIIVLVACCLPAHAEEYRDPVRHFSLQIPEGWGKAPPELVATANELGKRTNMSFDVGFQPVGQPAGVCPYVLIQFIPGNVSSYEEVERDLAKGAQAGLRRGEGLLSDVIKKAALHSVVFDRKNNRALSRIAFTGADGRKRQAISYSMLGKLGFVSLNCYAYDEDFETHLPTFNRMAESFRYDEGLEFVPRTGRPELILGAIAAAIAVAFFVVYRLSKRAARRTV
jgi:hypothetical protein